MVLRFVCYLDNHFDLEEEELLHNPGTDNESQSFDSVQKEFLRCDVFLQNVDIILLLFD